MSMLVGVLVQHLDIKVPITLVNDQRIWMNAQHNKNIFGLNTHGVPEFWFRR